jgi:inner membrane transporter RhtA
MSIHPVLAALAGLVILQQVLDLHEWAGILIVVTANVLAVAAAQAQSRTTSPAPGSSVGSRRIGAAI